MRPTSPRHESSSSSWLTRLHQSHERLKRSVHEGMRVPLPAWGRRFMGLVYFTIPIVGGYYVMQWAIGKAHKSIGEHGEFLPNKDQPVGGEYIASASSSSAASSKGSASASAAAATHPTYGVPLVSSDEESQRRNKEKLQKYLRRLQKQSAAAASTDKSAPKQAPQAEGSSSSTD